MAISEQLQQRIDALIGDRPRNPVQNLPYDPSGPPPEFISGPYDPRNKPDAVPMPLPASAGQGVGQMTDEDKQRLLMEIEAEQGALTPEEKIQAIGSFEAMAQQAQAPLAEQAMEIQHMGSGSDTVLAHLEPGDVIIPPALLEDDPEFESYLERKFDQYDIMPESRVMQGIGALDSGVKLNPHTGLPEFGFFKKIAKFAKKIVRPVAKIAQFIPGPWQPVAAMADKALTVYDVAKGDASPLALLSVAGPLRTGPSFGESFDAFKTGGGFKGAWANTGVAGQGGIADLFNKSGTSMFGGDSLMSNVKGVFKSANPDDYILEPNTGEYINKITGEVGLPFGATDPSELLSRSGSGIQRLTGGLQGNLFGAEGMAGGLEPVTNASGQITGYADQAGNVYGADMVKQAGYSIDPNTGNIIQQIAGGAGAATAGGGVAGAGGIGSLLGGGGGLLGGGGIGDAFKLAGTLGLAGALGKLAYEDTKNMKGVPITPMTAMGPTGRFNIEAEIARRMGQEAPNPVEFGLLPQGTIPELSGGKPLDESATILPINAAYGGEVRGVPMQVLRPVAVPSMMPLPPAPINFEIPENYLAAKDAMRENIETPVGLSPDGAPLLPAPPPSSPLAADGTPYVSPLLLEQLQATTDPFGGADEGLNPLPTQPAPPTGGFDILPVGHGEKQQEREQRWATNPPQPGDPEYVMYNWWLDRQNRDVRACPSPEEHIQLANNDWILAGELKVGDEVITSKEPQKVTFAKTIEDSPRREVLFTEGDSIVTSPSHPYFVKDKGFVDVEDLKEGDEVGDLVVSEVKPFSDGPVIHISVDKAQTYMLRGGTEENPVPALSHNKTMKPPRPAPPTTPQDPYMGQGGPSPEQLEKLRIDQEAWSKNPMRFSSEPYWLNQFWYKPQGWQFDKTLWERPTRPDTPTVGPSGKPFPIPPRRPMDADRPINPNIPPRIGRPLPSVPLGPSDRPMSVGGMRKIAGGRSDLMRLPEPVGTPSPYLRPQGGRSGKPTEYGWTPPPVDPEEERIRQMMEEKRNRTPLPQGIVTPATAEERLLMAPTLMPSVPERPIGGLSSITEKIRRRPRSRIRGMNMGGMAQMARRSVPPVLGSGYGPYISMPNARGFANGGAVAMQDFQPMNGHINGIGTETSDEIPAMLSDGEFVMTGRGVRGAGSYVMEKNQGGIINLVPSLGEDRERGTQLMYGLMDEFGSRANA